MIDALDHLTLAVPSVDAAVTAYETLLGRRSDTNLLQLANVGLAFEQAGETPGPLSSMVFATPALGQAARLLERRAVPAARQGDLLALSLDATHQVPIRLIERIGEARAPSPLAADDEAAIAALDHVVIRTPDPERAVALYAGRLGLDLRLDRSNPQWGARLLFFRCGDLVLEVSHDLRKGVADGPDRLWGLAWRVPNIGRAHRRLEAAGVDVSEPRDGRRPGSRVFTVRSHAEAVPTLVIGGIGRWGTP